MRMRKVVFVRIEEMKSKGNSVNKANKWEEEQTPKST